MARRRSQQEVLEAGSDSFLDIVANIVGILIILIVIAGVRMIQAPVNKEQETASEERKSPEIELPAPEPVVESEKGEEASADESLSFQQITAQLGNTDEIPFERRETRDPTWEPDEARRKSLETAIDKLSEEVEAKNARLVALREQYGEAEAKKQTLSQSSEAAEARLVTLSSEQEKLQEAYRQLEDQLAMIEEATKPQEQLAHSIVPVSQLVDGEEWHFELRNGKIAFIPLEELLDRVKSRVGQRLRWIMEYGEYEGLVGPVSGYSVRFLAGPEGKSIVDELAYGRTQTRIRLMKWELVTSSGIPAETLAEAQKPNSLYQSQLRRISRNDTITFWVYPGSFDVYRQLVKIAQEQGYHVAARPLPQGKPIGGSPDGSRSLSQ